MSNVKTADYAASVPASGVIGLDKIIGPSATPDISKVTAKGWPNRTVPQVINGKFVAKNPHDLIDTNRFYSNTNPVYFGTTFSWSPGTLSPFERIPITVSFPSVKEGDAVMIGAPYALQGCSFDWSVSNGSVDIELMNFTPYDVTLGDGIWTIKALK